jgi:hypothetical protein
MDRNDGLQDLAHIRGLMERSTRFLSLSGLSGVVAGTCALLGAVGAQRYMHVHGLVSGDPYRYGSISGYWEHVLMLGLIALVVLVVSIAAAVWFTWRRSRHTGQGLWDRSARRLLVDLFIPLAAGGIFCLALVLHGLPALVPAATLIFYGLSLLNASHFTFSEIRWLGLSELLLGLVAAFWLDAGLLFWALGFGLLHIFYGVLMYLRHERGAVAAK